MKNDDISDEFLNEKDKFVPKHAQKVNQKEMNRLKTFRLNDMVSNGRAKE